VDGGLTPRSSRRRPGVYPPCVQPRAWASLTVPIPTALHRVDSAHPYRSAPRGHVLGARVGRRPRRRKARSHEFAAKRPHAYREEACGPLTQGWRKQPLRLAPSACRVGRAELRQCRQPHRMPRPLSWPPAVTGQPSVVARQLVLSTRCGTAGPAGLQSAARWCTGRAA
jgi:hypothetical protein